MALTIVAPSSLLSLLMSSGFVVASFLMRPACGSFVEPSAATGNETDRQALLAFKDGITKDPFGALSSWNHSIHFCQWFGVACGRRHPERVTELKLGNLQLQGSISPHIGNLSFLRQLELSNNSLGQQIPPEIGRLRRLHKITLRNNSITGPIPVNISSCSNLVLLNLHRNMLEGEIPVEIGDSLTKLQGLHIGFNRLEGIIPTNLANLSSLALLYISMNRISGAIPDQLGRLRNLEKFAVQGNKLAGTIPPSIFNISSMRIFIVNDNRLRGSLPVGLGGVIFPHVEYFDVGQNSLHGNIPVSISNASNLEFLAMNGNNFVGDIPSMEKLKLLWWFNLADNLLGTSGRFDDFTFMSSLSNATHLQFLGLSNNSLGGELPGSVGNLSNSNMESLVLYANEISGSIPTGIGNLLSLTMLTLWGNKFTGKIPSIIGKLNKLQLLDLSVNQLNGTIPLSFGNLSILNTLCLRKNSLHGTIPSSLGKCTNLQGLSLSSNNLQGNIPREIFSISSFYSIYLDGNRLTGSLPREVGSLINLNTLDVSENMLSGKLPDTLGSCVALIELGMASNNFRGVLPSSLRSLRGLEELNLSRNNFSGLIPGYLEGFKLLQSLDLSFNNFEGAVPETGVFTNTTAFDVEGNIKLCGGMPQLQLPSCKSKSNSQNPNMKLIILISFGVVGVVLMLSFVYFCLFKKSTELASLRLPWNSLLKLSYQSLYEATNGFSSSNLIGKGSFGSVYKGFLHQGRQAVAVKVLNLERRGASRSFMAECEALRRIRHRNLVKVLTACSSIDHQGNDFKALVYEYMANGSLSEWLHSHENQNEMQADSRNFNITKRLDIAIDVASALEYLHHGCEEPIVHCDLKPSNILLDDDMVGHVGDFGLAKFLQEHTHRSSESQSSTVGVRGSVGYVAPEYGIGNEVSISGDVYSYGILLLEMFTGKRPTDHHMFNNCLNLHEYVKIALPEQVATVADSRLFIQPNGDEDEIGTRSSTQIQELASNEKIEVCIVSLLEVGIACSRELPGDRMTINEAISQLHTIKKALIWIGVVQRGGRARTPQQVPEI